MESTQTMELFNTLFYVSLTIAILGLIAAVSLFFLFDIPTVFALMTGRAKKKTIERMISQSGKGESLRKERAATVLANAETSGNLNRSSKLKRGNPAPAPMPAPAPAPAPTQMPTPAQNADDGETVMLSGQTANQSWQQPAAAPQPVPPAPPQPRPQPVQPAAPQPQPVQPPELPIHQPVPVRGQHRVGAFSARGQARALHEGRAVADRVPVGARIDRQHDADLGNL